MTFPGNRLSQPDALNSQNVLFKKIKFLTKTEIVTVEYYV